MMMPADKKPLSPRDSLILRRATSADVDALAEFYLSSFVKNPWSSLVFS
jgi:hypothetical protein